MRGISFPLIMKQKLLEKVWEINILGVEFNIRLKGNV